MSQVEAACAHVNGIFPGETHTAAEVNKKPAPGISPMWYAAFAGYLGALSDVRPHIDPNTASVKLREMTGYLP